MSDYLGINAVHELLPTGSKIGVMWRGRMEGAVPEPDVQLSIIITGRAQAVPAWKPDRARRWVADVENMTRGNPLRYTHLKFLRNEREPWWTVKTEHLATFGDLHAVCPTFAKQTLRWRLRDPKGWWHSESVTVGNRTGWRLDVARRIIDDLGLPLDLTRWAHLAALTDPGPGSIAADREVHLAALTATA